MAEGRKEPLTHAGLIAHKLAIEARADVIGEQSSDDAASLKTLLTLLHYEIASNHVMQQMAAAKVHEFFDFARPEPADAGPHAVGWRCTVEGARMGNLSLRAQDRVLRAALALQRLYALIGGGNGDGTWTWARPDWLDAFPEMTPENLAKANAAQKAADERRRREAAGEQPKLHAAPGQRRGQLKNGNPAGDYLASPRCGATTRAGGCCRQPAMASPGGSRGRCCMHGGLSTGPRTVEGQARARSARFVHGCRTADIIDFRAAAARSARRLAMLTAAANASLHRVAGEGRGGGLSANSPAGHGVHRSVSPASLESVALNHRDTACLGEAEAASLRRSQEAQRDRVARVIPLHQAKTVIARPRAAQESFETSPLARTAPQHLRSSAFICGSKLSYALESRKNALLAGTAAFISPLCASVPRWFKATNSAAPAGHGVHRSVSAPPLGRRRAAG
jgi:hypothetical protein